VPDELQFAILSKQGVNAWNDWREQLQTGNVTLDLSKVDLRGANLRLANVWLANCYGRADFTGNRAAQVNWPLLSERIRWQ
jgi:uncharacterized protein YjbI with pentapeptide repeats